MNKYVDRIINLAKEKNARIVLPEVHDKRIQEARKELESIGFDVLDHEEYRDKITFYIDFLKKRSFTSNWPIKNIEDYLNDPFHLSTTMLACNDVDGVIAGADTPSSEIIRTAIRIIGLQNTTEWVSSIFFLSSRARYSG